MGCCWDRVSGQTRSCIRQPKRKLPENGSLHFFVKKGGLEKGLGLSIEGID